MGVADQRRWTALGFAALHGLVVIGAACQPPPYYDDAIGVSGVATEPGALVGTWAVHQRNVYLGWVPILSSEVESGADQYFAVERTWDADAAQYGERWQLCADIHFETAGLLIEPTAATVQQVVMQAPAPAIEHATGAFAAADLLQLWALRGMPDPLQTPVPTPDDYQQSPQRDWIYDADNDGKLATTVMLTGVLEGEEYYVNRKLTQQRGVVASPDQIIGLLEVRAAWSVLDASVAMAVHHGEIPSDSNVQHPDPKRSWFEQRRLAAAGGCAGVMAAVDRKLLSTTRPF